MDIEQQQSKRYKPCDWLYNAMTMFVIICVFFIIFINIYKAIQLPLLCNKCKEYGELKDINSAYKCVNLDNNNKSGIIYNCIIKEKANKFYCGCKE